jgi:hypothetical protein
MKRLLLFVAVIFVTASIASAQFFRPVPKDLFSGDRAVKSEFLLRPAVNVASNLFKWDNTLKKVYNMSFARIGMGVSYAHYIEVEGEPYNNFSINLLALMPTGTEISYMSFGVTFAALDVFGLSISAGPLYDFNKERPFIENIGLMTGVQMTF